MSNSVSFDIDYRRSYGVHSFTTADKTPITALSFPVWEEYLAALQTLLPTEGYIISPELITAEFPLGSMPAQKELIESRIADTLWLSLNRPEASVIVGTVSFDGPSLARNSLAVIRQGNLEGHIDKRGVIFDRTEAAVFSRESRPQAKLRSAGHQALVCSDLIVAGEQGLFGSSDEQKRLLGKEVETVILSSCWSVPRTPAHFLRQEPDETRYRDALERSVGRLFGGHPALKDVIVVDRVPDGVDVAPLNAHFKRLDS